MSQLVWVKTPEWADGNDAAGVWVRPLSGRERAKWQEQSTIQGRRVNKVDYDRVVVGAVIMATVDESGRPLFSQHDELWLLDKSSGVLERISDAILTLSGLNEENLDELKKSSKGTTIDGSYSVSPSPSDEPSTNSWEPYRAPRSAHGEPLTPSSLSETVEPTSGLG
jgi:hypothetical protein